MPRTLDFFAWYPADYRADTTHLTREEDFAYRAILDEIFLTNQASCRIEDDDEYIARITKSVSVDEWKRIRRVLIDGPRAPLTKRGKWISSGRLTREIAKAHDKSKKNSQIARDGWDKRRHSERNANASDSQSVSDAIRREEKRREETREMTSSSRTRKPSGREQIEGFTLTPELIEYARGHGQDATALAGQFKDHFRANGYRTTWGPVRDAAAAFRNWVRNAAKFDRPRAATNVKQFIDPSLSVGRASDDSSRAYEIQANVQDCRFFLREHAKDGSLNPPHYCETLTLEQARAYVESVEEIGEVYKAPTLAEFLRTQPAKETA